MAIGGTVSAQGLRMKRSLVGLVLALSAVASAQDDGLPGAPITARSRELAHLSTEVAAVDTRTPTWVVTAPDDQGGIVGRVGLEVEKMRTPRGRVGAQDVVTKSLELRGPADEEGIRPFLRHERTRWGPGGEVDRRVFVGGEVERGDIRYRAMIGGGSGGAEARVGFIWRFR